MGHSVYIVQKKKKNETILCWNAIVFKMHVKRVEISNHAHIFVEIQFQI